MQDAMGAMDRIYALLMSLLGSAMAGCKSQLELACR